MSVNKYLYIFSMCSMMTDKQPWTTSLYARNAKSISVALKMFWDVVDKNTHSWNSNSCCFVQDAIFFVFWSNPKVLKSDHILCNPLDSETKNSFQLCKWQHFTDDERTLLADVGDVLMRCPSLACSLTLAFCNHHSWMTWFCLEFEVIYVVT